MAAARELGQAHPVSSEAPFATGQVLAGRYVLEHQLGRGGMGSVWLARHLVTRRRVALKLLKQTFELRQDMRQRLLREARAAASVGHPCVVEVLDVIELADGAPVLVMEHLEGETLGRLLQREGALPLSRTLSLLLPVVAAVGTAHLRGVVHRDLKPDNVFLQRRGERLEPKVLDFGIAKLLGEELRLDQALLTGTGVVLGTPCYMAPEQSFGERNVDARADIWSLGAIFYEALSGGRPVEGENLGQVIRSFLTQGITPLDALAPDVPDEVCVLVMHMLAKDAPDRPRDLAVVYDTLLVHAGGRSSWPGILLNAVPAPSAVTAAMPSALADALAPTHLAQANDRSVRDTATAEAQTVSIVSAPRKHWRASLGTAAVLGSAVALWQARTNFAPEAPRAAVALPVTVAAPVVVTPAPMLVEVEKPAAASLSSPRTVTSAPRRRKQAGAVTPSPLVSVTPPPAGVTPAAAPAHQDEPAPTPKRREGLEEEPPF